MLSDWKSANPFAVLTEVEDGADGRDLKIQMRNEPCFRAVLWTRRRGCDRVAGKFFLKGLFYEFLLSHLERVSALYASQEDFDAMERTLRKCGVDTLPLFELHRSQKVY